MNLFIDTWGWITLFNKSEPYHEKVKLFYQNLRTQEGSIYTSDYVLDETYTLLFKKISFQQALTALETIDESIQSGHLILIWINQERFDKTKVLRRRFRDKPDISFTDLSSMVIMEDLDLKSILTGDQHFLHLGLDFQLVP